MTNGINRSGQRPLEADQEQLLARRWREARRLAPKPITLDQLAHEFSISAERVRQIEAQTFQKVKRVARNRIGALRFGKQLAKPYLPQPSVAGATHRLERFSLGPSLRLDSWSGRPTRRTYRRIASGVRT